MNVSNYVTINHPIFCIRVYAVDVCFTFQFRTAVQDILKPGEGDSFLLRWLRGIVTVN